MKNTPDNSLHAREAAPQKMYLVADSHSVRVDRWLAEKVAGLSRARWQTLIREGFVMVNGRPCKPSARLHCGDAIEATIPPAAPTQLEPEPMALDVLYEDSDILVLNKPPGLVIHPAPGHPSGTLVNALLHHCQDLAGIGGELRPGIVHRLDRDTSGVLVVAKNQSALERLAAQFKRRQVRKVYWALAWGHFGKKSGVVETLIGRDPHNRKKMSARVPRGRLAITRYEVLREFGDACLVQVLIETGRTHQIRVHLAHIGHPVVGDRQYGRVRVSKRRLAAPRQMLHARTIVFKHPRSGRVLEFTAPLPDDMQQLVSTLETEATETG